MLGAIKARKETAGQPAPRRRRAWSRCGRGSWASSPARPLASRTHPSSAGSNQRGGAQARPSALKPGCHFKFLAIQPVIHPEPGGGGQTILFVPPNSHLQCHRVQLGISFPSLFMPPISYPLRVGGHQALPQTVTWPYPIWVQG